MKKFLALCVIFLLAAVCASPAAAYSTLVQFDPTATNDGIYGITGISEFDWQSSGSAVSEHAISASSVTNPDGTAATTYTEFLAGAVTGDWVDLTIHAQARLHAFLDTTGGSIDNLGLATGINPDGTYNGSYEVTTTLDIVERAIYTQISPTLNQLTFVSATGTFAYYLDDSPNSVVSSGAGFNDGDTTGLTPFLWGSATSVIPTSFSSAGAGASFINNTVLGYDSSIIEADPTTNAPLMYSTFDTTLTLFHGGNFIEIGGTIGGGAYPGAPGGVIPSYTVQPLDLILNADSNSEFGGAPIPEPTTMVLFGIGLLSLAGTARRKRA